MISFKKLIFSKVKKNSNRFLMTMVWLQLKTYVMELAPTWGEPPHSELNLGHLGMIVMMLMMLIGKMIVMMNHHHHHHHHYWKE